VGRANAGNSERLRVRLTKKKNLLTLRANKPQLIATYPCHCASSARISEENPSLFQKFFHFDFRCSTTATIAFCAGFARIVSTSHARVEERLQLMFIARLFFVEGTLGFVLKVQHLHRTR